MERLLKFFFHRCPEFFLILVFSLTFSPAPAQAKSKNSPTFIQQLQDLSSLIFSGQYLSALDQLKKSKLKKIQGALDKRLRFMSAFLQFQAGDYETAAKGFESLRKDYGLLGDYVDYYRALSLREAGKTDQAIKVLKQLKDGSVSPYLKNRIERELAWSYCKKGDRASAINLFNSLIQTESSDIISYHLRYDRSRCLLDLGYQEEALPTLRSLYLNYPEGDLSDDIREALKQIGKGRSLSVSDHLQRAAQLMAHQRPGLAALDFEEALHKYAGRAPLTLREQLAEAYFDAKDYPQAAKILEEIRDQYPESFDLEKQTQLAKCYARSDQFKKAIHAYQELLASSPAAEAPDLEYKIAFLYMDKGDYERADKLFLELLNKYPHHPQKQQIYWHLAWDHYLLKKYPEALKYLGLLEQDYPNGPHARGVPYWRARILEKQGHKEAARKIYQNIADDQEFTYYGFLSLKRLEKNWDPTLPPKNHWASELPRLAIPAPFSLNRLESGGKQEIQRLKELLLLGLWEDFLGELNGVTAPEGISGELRELKNGVDGINETELLYPEERWGSSYPPAYATLVSLFSQTRNLPMPLTWAIMREESHFNPSAVSPAQAIGLMQIIPPTGSEIAQQLNRKGFFPEQLYQPVTNIEYGVHFLATNRQNFNGNLPETIASYNAGPQNVARWVAARPGRDWDEFIEEIPYRETNHYVKKVLKSYYIYSLLYSS